MTTIGRRPLRRKRRRAPAKVDPQASNTPYRVGPGFPPREHQFKPGQSGNPAGARNGPASIAPDLKILLQAELSKKVTLTIGDKERTLTKAAAGIEQLVNQFARGDRNARRDLFDLADKLGLDLGASSKAALEKLSSKALTAEDEAIVADFLDRHAGKSTGNKMRKILWAQHPNSAQETTMKKTDKAADRRTIDALIRTDFATFVRVVVFPTLSPSATYDDNWHIKALCHKLEQVRRGKINRLIINVPPRSMKSTICSIAFPAFLLGNDPAIKIICSSYSSDLAIKFGNDCREVMNSSLYRRLFPDTKISRHKNTETEFATTKMGGRMSTSTEGGVTGRGGNIIILDDPIKPNDVLSDSKRERLNNTFFNTFLSRLDDKRTGAIVVVMQRLHEDDLVGRLLRDAPREWTHFSVPAIAVQEELIEIGDGRYHVRRVGDVLHAEREPLSVLESYRAQIGPDVFAAQYQQSPVPRDGAMIKRAWLRYYDGLPQRSPSSLIIQSWDTATKDSERSSYSVCTTWLLQDKRYYLIDVFRERVDYPTLRAQAISLAKLHKASAVLIEDTGVGTALVKELKAAALPAIAVKPERDKRTRMWIQSGKFANGQVLFPKEAPWRGDLDVELFGFPGGRFDDQVDSISQALAHEISFAELMTDKALKGYSNLTEALCFSRLFSG